MSKKAILCSIAFFVVINITTQKYLIKRGIMKNLFDEPLLEIFEKYINLEKVNEIRMRLNKRLLVYISGKPYYIAYDGITNIKDKAIVVSREMLYNVIKRATERSLYAVNNQLKQGFLTVLGGIRIGICGEVVIENGKVQTIKNFSSINIRVAREVKNCSLSILEFLLTGGFCNTLIISPPGCGKTTLIRDILYQMSVRSYTYNILLADERYEIANCFNGKPTLDVGEFTDIISGVEKAYAFNCGIRTMNPDIVVTDELSTKEDLESIMSISSCGVKVLASVHAKDIEDLKNKKDFQELLAKKVFKRFVVLDDSRGPGSIAGVYDESFRCLYV